MGKFATLAPIPVFYADSPDLDAFHRKRVSAPFTLFDSKLLVDKNPLVWDEVISGGGASSTYSVPQVSMGVTSNGEYVIRQTKARFNYQPGKSQQIFLTGILNPEANTEKRAGYFSSSVAAPYTANYDGLFFSTIGAVVNVNQAKDGTVTTVAQSAWNKDKMNGTGTSGANLDFSKTQLMFIDFEWLGVGNVRFGFFVNRIPVVCHEFVNGNALTATYTNSPNQPLRWELRSTGSAGTLVEICGTVTAEGVLDPIGALFSTNSGATQVDANTSGTEYAAIGLRLKTTYRMATIIFNDLSLLSTTANDVFRWALLLNPTVASTFTYGDITNSALQSAYGATANTITGGTCIASGYVSQQLATDINLKTAIGLGTTLAGVQDTIVLTVMGIAGSTNMDVFASISWRELV